MSLTKRSAPAAMLKLLFPRHSFSGFLFARETAMSVAVVGRGASGYKTAVSTCAVRSQPELQGRLA